jgi:hypothetical protein
MSAILNLSGEEDFDVAKWIQPIPGDFFVAYTNLNRKVWTNDSTTSSTETSMPAVEYFKCSNEELETAKIGKFTEIIENNI